eukprot:1143616-Pelagomonas_calceolata.AAC.1
MALQSRRGRAEYRGKHSATGAQCWRSTGTTMPSPTAMQLYKLSMKQWRKWRHCTSYYRTSMTSSKIN